MPIFLQISAELPGYSRNCIAYSAAPSVPACTGMFCGASGSYLYIRRQKSGNSTYRLLIVSHSFIKTSELAIPPLQPATAMTPYYHEITRHFHTLNAIIDNRTTSITVNPVSISTIVTIVGKAFTSLILSDNNRPLSANN